MSETGGGGMVFNRIMANSSMGSGWRRVANVGASRAKSLISRRNGRLHDITVTTGLKTAFTADDEYRQAL